MECGLLLLLGPLQQALPFPPIDPNTAADPAFKTLWFYSAREEKVQNFSPNYEISGIYEPF